MVVLNVILWHDSPIDHLFLREEIHRVGLLQQGVPHILLVGEHPVNDAGGPFRAAGDGADAVRF